MQEKILVGHKLRRFRQSIDLSQTVMAETLDISPSYLNLLEHNQRPLTVSLLLRLGSAFDSFIIHRDLSCVARVETDFKSKRAVEGVFQRGAIRHKLNFSVRRLGTATTVRTPQGKRHQSQPAKQVGGPC